jgi:opacity protein-like surface antigen
MRYYNFFNGVTLTPAGSPLTSVPLSQSATWVDLVVGVRGRAPLLPGLDAFARGDIGGFGMGTSSTLAWNVIAGLSWQTTEHLSLVAGYRDFDINAAQGSGTTRFAFHAKMQGPFIAFALQY